MTRRGIALGLGLAATVAAVGIAAIADPPSPPRPSAPVIEMPSGRVRVEVLNKGGVGGMARAATLLLRDVGFDVVDFGNAPPFDPDVPSSVTDRVGSTDAARAVAVALGIDNVLSDPDPNLYVDVSVLLGSEWTPPAWRGGGGEGSPERAWWDVRRFLQR